jgi:nucleotide-binding universal stress UspA family protein
MNATRQIVVGVDGSAAGQRALRWALAEARRRNEPIQAVIAWRWDALDSGDAISSAAADEAAATLLRQIEAVPVLERADVPIVKQVREGRPGDVLTAAARGADLLVIGSHGHSHRLQEVLGSTAEECVRNASCPVIVLPANQPRMRRAEGGQ